MRSGIDGRDGIRNSAWGVMMEREFSSVLCKSR